jgi:hypothetical protein
VTCLVVVVKGWAHIILIVVILVVAILDAIIMGIYIAHSDECSINADEVYKAIEERKRMNQARLRQLSYIDSEDIGIDMTVDDKKAQDNTLLDSEMPKDDKNNEAGENFTQLANNVEMENADETVNLNKDDNDAENPMLSKAE